MRLCAYAHVSEMGCVRTMHARPCIDCNDGWALTFDDPLPANVPAGSATSVTLSLLYGDACETSTVLLSLNGAAASEPATVSAKQCCCDANLNGGVPCLARTPQRVDAAFPNGYVRGGLNVIERAPGSYCEGLLPLLHAAPDVFAVVRVCAAGQPKRSAGTSPPPRAVVTPRTASVHTPAAAHATPSSWRRPKPSRAAVAAAPVGVSGAQARRSWNSVRPSASVSAGGPATPHAHGWQFRRHRAAAAAPPQPAVEGTARASSKPPVVYGAAFTAARKSVPEGRHGARPQAATAMPYGRRRAGAASRVGSKA